MAHVMHWARENKMSLNLLKTVELVFRRPNVSCDLLPPALPDINGVCDANKLLWVYFRHDFNFSKHVESVVAICNQRLCLLAQLKKQGLGMGALDSVFNAIVLNKILYALPVYFGYLTEGHKDTGMLRRVLKSQSNGFHILRIWLGPFKRDISVQIISPLPVWTTLSSPSIHRQTHATWRHAP